MTITHYEQLKSYWWTAKDGKVTVHLQLKYLQRLQNPHTEELLLKKLEIAKQNLQELQNKRKNLLT